MAKLPESYDFGNIDELSVKELVFHLQDIYRDLVISLNEKPDVVYRESDAAGTENHFDIGDININTTTDKVEIATNHDGTTVTWTTLS